MSTQDIATRVHDLRELKRMAEELTDEIKVIEDLLKAHMTERQTDKLTGPDYKVCWTPYSTSRIDTTALKAELPDIAARYTKTTETRRFSIA